MIAINSENVIAVVIKTEPYTWFIHQCGFATKALINNSILDTHNTHAWQFPSFESGSNIEVAEIF